MIDSLVSNKTRVKLLLKFFLSDGTQSYLRGLESEFGASTNSIRVELNRLQDAGMLVSHADGNKRVYSANRQHPLYDNIRAIVRKHVGLDRIVDTITANLGHLEAVFLAGSFSRGLDSAIIDLVLVGDIDRHYLIDVLAKAESLISRKIRHVVYDTREALHDSLASFDPPPVLIWERKALPPTP